MIYKNKQRRQKMSNKVKEIDTKKRYSPQRVFEQCVDERDEILRQFLNPSEDELSEDYGRTSRIWIDKTFDLVIRLYDEICNEKRVLEGVKNGK